MAGREVLKRSDVAQREWQSLQVVVVNSEMGQVLKRANFTREVVEPIVANVDGLQEDVVLGQEDRSLEVVEVGQSHVQLLHPLAGLVSAVAYSIVWSQSIVGVFP